jgi:3-oxoacyl-[acyl-carrier protein] reductase
MSDRKRFAGRVAFITGASQGIGKAVATDMASQGAAVALFDITTGVNEVARELAEQGLKAMALTGDVRDEKNIKEAVDEVVQKLGGVHILVNNAGKIHSAPMQEVTEKDWDQVVGVNLKGVFFCTKHCFEFMKKERYGKIVNIGSRAGLGKQDRTVYSATKAGIVGLTRTWALEMAPHNVNVNNVAPGPIATELFDAGNPAASPKTKAIVNSIPLKRMGQPEDVARAVSFLASAEADFITGQTLFVCGGLSVGGVYY